MEDFDGWIASATDGNRTSGLAGQAFLQAQPTTGLLAAASAWQSKRQRTLPAQQQLQQHDSTSAQLDQLPAQHNTPENPIGHPTPVPSQWISRSNHQSYHQHDQQQQYTQATQPTYAPTAAAAPASADAPAPIWHQKQRLPTQQQQQENMPAHISSLQANQHTYSSSQGYLGGSRGRASSWGGLRGEDGEAGAAHPTAGQQQEQQQWQHRQHRQQMQQSDQLWGGDEDAAGQQQWREVNGWGGEGQQQLQQQQHLLWGEEEDVWRDENAAADANRECDPEQQQQQEGDEIEDGRDEEAGGGDQAGDEEEEQEEEVQLESAEFDLSRDEVIERIEQLAVDLISAAAAGQLPTLSCVSTARSNVHMAPRNSTLTTTASRLTQGSGTRYTQQGLGGAAGTQTNQQGLGRSSAGGAYADEEDEEGLEGSEAAAAPAADEEAQQHVLRLGSKTQTKSLMASAGAQANSIVRALQLLDSVHSVLRSGRSSTQRDIYYNLVGRPGFQATRDVSSAIRSVLGMLRVPRSALGISAASKGAVAGCLLLRSRPGEPWADCRSVGPSGRPIPGEVGAVDATALRSAGARFILVVEKDAVFQSLVESRLHDQLPCILITGRGMPDVASRAFLAAVVEASKSWGTAPAAAAAAGSFGGSASLSSQWQQQSLPVLGLVDWNPGGVSILLAYKYGCAALGLESARYAVPSLSWLGVTSHMLQEGQVPQSRCHALSDRDRTLMPGLKARLANCPDWVQELEEMEGSGLKADIEALQHEELMRQVQQRVLQGSYLR